MGYFDDLPIMNSTATVAAAATFSTPIVDAEGYDEVAYFVRAGAALGNLVMAGSVDGTTFRTFATIPVGATDPATKGAEKLDGIRYLRTRFENGANAQTTFEIRQKLRKKKT